MQKILVVSKSNLLDRANLFNITEIGTIKDLSIETLLTVKEDQECFILLDTIVINEDITVPILTTIDGFLDSIPIYTVLRNAFCFPTREPSRAELMQLSLFFRDIEVTPFTFGGTVLSGMLFETLKVYYKTNTSYAMKFYTFFTGLYKRGLSDDIIADLLNKLLELGRIDQKERDIADLVLDLDRIRREYE